MNSQGDTASTTRAPVSSLRVFGTAECQQCPLGSALSKRDGLDGWRPVPRQRGERAWIAMVGEAPGEKEVLRGYPFAGPSGKELQDAIDLVGLSRSELCLTNVLACRPPGNAFKLLMARLQRANRERRARGADEHRSPLACCRPRLLDEVEGFDHVLCLGGPAMRAVSGRSQSIDQMRGSCEVIPAPWDHEHRIKVAYTVHPARVLPGREPQLREVFQHDVAKALRFFRGKLSHPQAQLHIARDCATVERGLTFFTRAGKFVAYDVETTEHLCGAMVADLLCIGFSNGKHELIVPWRSRRDRSPLLGAADSRVQTYVARWLENPPVPLVGHNAGQFDRIVVERELGVTPRLAADTMILHLLADNDRPHKLGFIVSFLTDYPQAWKADHHADESGSDEELHVYNGKDCTNTVAVAPVVYKLVKVRHQEHLIARENLLQDIGVAMQRNGLRVDLSKARELECEYADKHDTALRELREHVGGRNFNPNSYDQLSSLLFEKWRLPVRKVSDKTGSPSTDDSVLRGMLMTRGLLDAQQEKVVKLVRRCRYYVKLLGTNIRPLRPWHQGGIVLDDGRVHPSYHRIPASGRYSSGDPMNAQNLPEKLRVMLIPADGYVYVGADAESLELRLIAEEARAERLLATFADRLDAHNETMEWAYGPDVWRLPGAPDDRRKKGDGVFKQTRAVTKNTRYAWDYGAGVPRIWEQVTSSEDDDGELLHGYITLDAVNELCEKLAEMDPEIPLWWKHVEKLWRKQGFLADPIWGRRRDFKGKHERSDLANHPIQSGGFHIVAEAMIELLLGEQPWFATERLDRIPLPSARAVGAKLVTQTHDSMLWEAPEEAADEWADSVGRAMTRRRKENALVSYTPEVKKGFTWKEV